MHRSDMARTTSGMIVADAIGIIIGVVLGKKIPEKAVKWFAASMFILFGIIGLYGTISKHYFH
jgi:putative Ca2+/H+ antiporter (TMEM165/GDT1 family)